MGGCCQLTGSLPNNWQIDVPGLVVHLVAETGGVDDGQGDAGSFLVKFEFYRRDSSQISWRFRLGMLVDSKADSKAHTNSDGLDLDALLGVRSIGVIGLLVGQHRLAAEGVDKSGSAWEDRGR